MSKGIEGLVTGSKTRTFNKPWMENINQDLLVRYWRKKNTADALIVKHHGVKIKHWRTPFGEVKTLYV